MALWRQIKPSQINFLSTHLKRSYFQIHVPYAMNKSSSLFKVAACSFPSLPHQKGQFDIPSTNFRFYAAPAQYMQKKEDKDVVRLNEEITADVVRVVTEEGHTVMPKHRALGLAKSRNLDLVEVQRNATPPVCKIMDYKRESYQKVLKEKERVKEKGKSGSKLKTGDCKEVRFSGKITQQDLQIKADMVKRLMEKGHRVKCLAVGRTIKQTGAAEDSKTLISRFLSMIEDITIIEADSRLLAKKDQTQASENDQTQAVEKDQTHVIVRHIKFGPLKKGLGKNAGKSDKSPSANSQVETSENDLKSQENFCESNLNSSAPSNTITEPEYRSNQKTAAGVTENRYLKNTRDRSQPYDSTRNSSPQFNNTNPSFQQRRGEYMDNGSSRIQNQRNLSPPRQAANNSNTSVGEQTNQQTVVNRYKLRNPSDPSSARDPRPNNNNTPFPRSRINNRDQTVVDKDNTQGKWGVFSGDSSNRIPEGQGSKVTPP